MPAYIKLFALFSAILFSVVFVSLIRRRSTNPFISFLWLGITILMFSAILFEGFYKWIATQMGLTDASFLVEVCVILFLLVYVLYLSIKLSEMNDRVQELISFTSILEKRSREGSDK